MPQSHVSADGVLHVTHVGLGLSLVGEGSQRTLELIAAGVASSEDHEVDVGHVGLASEGKGGTTKSLAENAERSNMLHHFCPTFTFMWVAPELGSGLATCKEYSIRKTEKEKARRVAGSLTSEVM